MVRFSLYAFSYYLTHFSTVHHHVQNVLDFFQFSLKFGIKNNRFIDGRFFLINSFIHRKNAAILSSSIMSYQVKYSKELIEKYTRAIRDKDGKNKALPEDCDVTITSSFSTDLWQIGCHRVLLNLVSPKFLRALQNQSYELNTTMEALYQFRQFFYTSEIILSLEHISEVLELIHNYGTTAMMTECSVFLGTKLDEPVVANFFEIYGMAKKYDELKTLRTLCINKIVIAEKEIIANDLLIDAEHDLLMTFIESADLKCKDSDLLDLIIRWGKHRLEKCKNDGSVENVIRLRNEIKVLIQFIRFKSMNINDFVTVMKDNEEIFDGKDWIELMQMYLQPNFQSEKFSNELRSM